MRTIQSLFSMLVVVGLTACATGGMTAAESVTRLEQRQKASPASADVNRSLGIAYYKATRYPEARAALETAARLDPRDGTTSLYLGLTDEALGDLPGAKTAYASYIQFGRTSRVRSQLQARLAALRQPNESSELSKQVFSLLILGRFVAQNPFQTSSGEGFVASQLRGSASAVLTDQLNNLTGKYLSGMGVDLGVTNQATYADNGSQGSRTDLNVAVRRQLLNNRLTVRVGTDIPLSGGTGTQASQGTSSVSNLAGDVSLEYTLLRDGRLRLRAYRQNGYEDIDGPIIRTGAALVFQRDYTDVAELFQKVSADVKQQRKESRRQEKVDKKVDRDSVKTITPGPQAGNTQVK